jgi:hypothetical protein
MAKGFKMSYQLTGVTDLRLLMRDLDVMTQVEVLKRASRNAAAPMVTSAKANLRANGSVRTGALLKSIGVKVIAYLKTQTIVAVIGARKGAYAVNKETGKLGKYRGGKGPIIPANYLHLVELGHRSVHGGGALPNYGEKVKGFWNSRNKGKSIRKGTAKATSYVVPKPFLRPAYEANKMAAEAALKAGFMKALQQTWKARIRRLNKRVTISMKDAA